MNRKSELALPAVDATISSTVRSSASRPFAGHQLPGRAAVRAEPVNALRLETGRAFAVIFAFLIVRLGLMVGLGLGVDEDYTLANSHAFALSYFDHPPLHQWIAGLSLAVFGFTSWVRLPFVLMFVGTSWALFTLTRHLFGAAAGFWALIALNLSAFFTLSAGEWVVPDGPLLLCLAIAANHMARQFFPGAAAPARWARWLSIGLWVGLAGLSKYSAVLPIVGLFAFMITSRTHRRWFLHPAPYAGAAVALAILTPVFVWNVRNRWVSFAFQTGRALPDHHFNPSHVVAIVAGQIGLLLPWVALPLVIALVTAIRFAHRGDRAAFLISLSLPAIIVFTVVPLWGQRGLPHWTMPGWFFTFPLLGAWLAKGGVSWLRPRTWSVVSGAAFALTVGVVISHASSGWIRRTWPPLFAAGDPTLESFSWDQLRTMTPFASAPQPDFIVATRWVDGAKLAAAFGGTIPVLVFSDDPRQFAFSHDVGAFVHKNAIIVVGAARADGELSRLGPFFTQLGIRQTLWLGRGHLAEVPLTLVRATDLVRPYPMPYPERVPVLAADAGRERQ